MYIYSVEKNPTITKPHNYCHINWIIIVTFSVLRTTTIPSSHLRIPDAAGSLLHTANNRLVLATTGI